MSSNTDYWAQREQDWLEECEKEEKSWNKAIDKIYTDLSAEIQEEVERFILRFGSAEGMDMATARRYLSATDIQYYASLAEKYCKQAHRDMADGTYSRDSSKEYFTEQANAEMRRYNAAMKISRLQMLQSQLALKTLNAQAKTNAVMETATIKRAESEFRRQAGILGETVLNNLDMVETLAKASFHGATFSERIWGPHQEKLQTKLNKAIRNMLILGKGAGPFTRELSRDLGVTKREAQRLLTTELARVQVQAQMESMIEAGFDQYTFITNPNCCNECRALNGKHFSLQKDKRAGRIPPIHPNCRCTTAAYVDEDTDDDFDEVEFDKWSESYDEHGLSWEEWKEKKAQTAIRELTKADFSQVQKTLKSYILNLENGQGANETEAESALATLQALIRNPFKGATSKIVASMTDLQDRVYKAQAVRYLRDEAGIKFVDAKTKKYQLSGQYLKEFTDWHKNFISAFPSYSKNPNYVHLPEIVVLPDRDMRGAYGAFTWYANSLRPAKIKLRGSAFHTYDEASRVAQLNYQENAKGVRFKSGQHPVHTLVHEYGHYVANTLDQLNGGGWQERFIRTCIQEFNATSGNSIADCSDLTLYLSEYGASSPGEAFAEAFSDAYLESNPHEFSKVFRKLLEEELNKW